VQRELGIRVDLIDGDREAQYGFLGAVRGLPVERGSCSTSAAAACS
jgi:exopolyphosphatase/pppGpp-phosphohydrolase